MKTPTFQLLPIALLLTLANPTNVQASDAGVANFVFGDVNVRSVNGATTALQKGKAVQSGDDIQTGPGAQAQIRFSDGGMVAIQPNSQFKLASYADKQDAKSDSFLVDLVRGGMRAITGLIGKRNRDNYKITTNTATIGIRGSSFLISYNPDGSVTVNAEQDAIVVCTNTGCTGLTAGESVQVKDKNQDPTRTTQRPTPEAAVPPPPPQEQTVTGNKVYALNDVQATFAVLTSSGYSASNFSTTNTGNKATAIVVDTPLVSYSDTDGTMYKGSSVASFNASGDPYAGDYIGWGYWSAGTKSDATTSSNLQDVHYVVARPTPTLEMPNVGTFDYNLIGGTAPTATNTSTGATQVGQLVGASMTVSFGTNSYIQSISTTTRFSGSDFTTSATGGTVNGNTFSASDSSTGSSFKGIFAGTGAAKAAFTYQQTGTSVGTISGAVGMTKGAENTLPQ